MSLDFVARINLVGAITSALLVGGTALGQDQQKKGASAAAKGDTSQAEKVSGVILKVEKVAKDGAAGSKAGKAKGEGKDDPGLLRLSINTNAVWRDWVRDQAQARDEGSPKEDAAKGANSVATKGQPADENSLVVIVVAPGTKIETRFRSPTDETSKGVTAPEKVKSDESTSAKVKPAGKPVQFRAEDLLPGLFVEAEFRGSGQRDKNQATTVTVIRPIKVIDPSPAVKSSPK